MTPRIFSDGASLTGGHEPYLQPIGRLFSSSGCSMGCGNSTRYSESRSWVSLRWLWVAGSWTCSTPVRVYTRPRTYLRYPRSGHSSPGCMQVNTVSSRNICSWRRQGNSIGRGT